MKFIKWKIFTITCAVCLLPIFAGLALWHKLPETMAIHFDINNTPDNFAPKWFVVFGLPLMMAGFQLICCLTTDISIQKHSRQAKLESAAKWIIPVLSIVLQALTLGVGLGFNPDIRRIVALLVGIIFITIGNYMPKIDYIKNYDTEADTARRINRIIGIETVILGVLFIISAFLPPFATVACLALLIPYSVLSVVHIIKNTRKK